ncbi:DUF3667 domain-containing protein [Flavobacterium sp. JAS]|uniref:DUF3667 domain-containing protein n=1 Tax=Flavobacterium sp. JAS TaxID=2897329 RepID=UPI001E443033|nr:DUF3667 domain-containing protein [Flavobacterium sp. JAS]MCD0469710.1 DUF3667 domain-containing protein [Flavobacterium sp. JAS]
MEIICKNCRHVFHGKYCNNCGQTADTHKINAHFLWHDIQHGLFHFDGGVPYSLKQLFTRPGHSIREFIEGKRVRHFKPLSLVAILAAFYGFLYHYYHINLFQSSDNSNLDLKDFNEWNATHFAWTTIATIPLFTIGTYIAFRNQGYNFVEYFVLNTFKAAQRLFLQILMFPFILYFNGTSHILILTKIIYILSIVLIFWTNIQFFNKITKTRAFFLSILSHLIFLVCFLIIASLLLLITGRIT